MIKRALFFPSSTYVATKWWHRLATIILWGWLAGVVVFTVNRIVFVPYESCISVQSAYAKRSLHLPDCGTDPFNYVAMGIAKEPLLNSILFFLVVGVAIYVLATLPGAVYRVVLYITVGAAWKDSLDTAV